jgi:hypothetical protein
MQDLVQIIGNLNTDNPVFVIVAGQIEKGLLEIVKGLGEISNIFAANLKNAQRNL